MDFKITILVINTIFNLSLGLLVWLRGVKHQTRLVFIVFSVAIALWSFGLAMFFLNTDQFIALLWAKTLYFAGSLIALSLCYFSFVFPNFYLHKSLKQLISWTLIITSILVFGFTLGTDLVLNGVIEGGNKGVIFGSGYLFWVTHFSVLMLIAFINLAIQFKKSNKLEQLQVKYILIGTLSAAIFGSATNVVLPTLGNFRFFSIGPLLTISMAGFIAYAIIKHRLMDIRLVIARTVAYSLLILITAVFYVSSAFFLSSLLLGFTTPGTQLIIYAFLAIIVAFSFERLRKFLEKVTDSFLFKGHYNSEELLKVLSNVMRSTIDLHSLTTNVLKVITQNMKIVNGAFVLLADKNQNEIEKIEYLGYQTQPLFKKEVIYALVSGQKLIIYDDLEDPQVKTLMRDLNVSIVLPLVVNADKIGVLLLGDKASGDIYSHQDITILDILGPQLTLAIQRSKEYDKIKRFNITLQQEVTKATTDLQDANEKLQVLDKLKDDFVSVASHELRTPMTAIRSYAWMALHKSDIKLSEKMEKYLVRILMSTERLINLVNDLLNISRIESGKIEINPEQVDVISLIRDIIDEVYYSKSTEKSIQFYLLEKPIPKVFADPEKLREVLLNLVGNSLKFTPLGGKITFDFFTDGKVVEISIKDSGVGISKEDLGRLFQKFSRLDNSYIATASSGGTGLGLYISKNIIELMHGKIWAQSEGEDKGATFTVSLPVASKLVLDHAGEYRIKPSGEAKPLEPVAL